MTFCFAENMASTNDMLATLARRGQVPLGVLRLHFLLRTRPRRILLLARMLLSVWERPPVRSAPSQAVVMAASPSVEAGSGSVADVRLPYHKCSFSQQQHVLRSEPPH